MSARMWILFLVLNGHASASITIVEWTFMTCVSAFIGEGPTCLASLVQHFLCRNLPSFKLPLFSLAAIRPVLHHKIVRQQRQQMTQRDDLHTDATGETSGYTE